MGHLSAATAIQEEILDKYPLAQVEVLDLIDYLFPAYSQIIYNSFNFLVRHCSFIYNCLNKVASRFSGTPLKTVMLNNIKRLIEQNKTDLVVSTLPICSQYISAFKETAKNSVPLYTYVTDISIQEEWISKNTDLYFVGAQATKNSLVSKGVDPEKIIISGIPVKQKFRQENAHQLMNVHTKKEILIMGGGLGLIPFSDVFLDTLSRNDQINVTIITGKNQKLFQQLNEKYPAFHIIGYTTDVHIYMKNADLIITKSGGITTFEAINIGTPLYILKPFLCQEVGNAEYIEQQNIGRVRWSNDFNIGTDLLSLLENPRLLQIMRSNMQNLRESWTTPSPIYHYEMRGARIL